jgi:hypothetical protein
MPTMSKARSHDASRKKKRFFVRPKRRRVQLPQQGPPSPAAVAKTMHKDASLLDLVEQPTVNAIVKKLKDVAPLLWSIDYKQCLAAETRGLEELNVLRPALELKAAAPLSTYTVRGRIRHPEDKAQQVAEQAACMGAQALRQNNQQMHVFSVCARSVSMFMHRTPMKDWRELQRKRMVLSRTTTLKLIYLMMECRPKPSYYVSTKISFHIFDQTFKKKGESRGKHRAAERVDASGDLVDLISMVIVSK